MLSVTFCPSRIHTGLQPQVNFYLTTSPNSKEGVPQGFRVLFDISSQKRSRRHEGEAGKKDYNRFLFARRSRVWPYKTEHLFFPLCKAQHIRTGSHRDTVNSEM